MKQFSNVSKFLRLDVKKSSSSGGAQAEVVAVAPAAQGSKNKTSFALHKDFKDYAPLVERLIQSGEFSPAAPSSCFIRLASEGGVGRGARHVLLVGTGCDGEGVNALGSIERLRRLGGSAAQKLAAEKTKDVVVHLDSFLVAEANLAVDAEKAAYAVAEGMGLASYKFKTYFTAAKKEEDPLEATFVSANAVSVAAIGRGLEQAQALLLGTYVARDLGNEPSNILYPASFADRARKLASAHGLKVTVLDEKALAREKMGLLIGVGQGSDKPPRLFVLEYNPSKGGAKSGKKGPQKTIAFVGKGMTFDSGGISIKPSGRMEDMKHDMCGAAAVVGAIVAAAELKLNARIFCVVASAENMPSGTAINPGNILTSRAGKTVEITNTDAEGRLILADALDYIQDEQPDYIIDLATLTGAVTITLGKTCSGLMGNDDDFNSLIKNAAKESGERVWELPLFEEYFDDLKSEYADMRNSGDTPSHGTAKGAMFLKQFIRKGVKWAHLDIAAMAYGLSGPYYPKKSSTGYGVRLLIELAKSLG